MIYPEVPIEEVSPSSSGITLTHSLSEIDSFCRLHRLGCLGLETAISSSCTQIRSIRRRRRRSEEEVPSNNTITWKKMKKEVVPPSSSSGICSLPDAIAVSILAHLSRLDYANLAKVSKSLRSLVALPELCSERRLKGCTEKSFYVCLRIFDEPTPSWFILTSKRVLSRISTSPYQPLRSSSFVVVGSGIYVIGGTIKGMPTSDVSLFDCFSHTWCKVPSMKMPRVSASVRLVDGKIYVSGGCGEEADSEVFDIKTQTWSNFITPELDHSINQGVVVIEKKKDNNISQGVVVTEKNKKKKDPGFYFLPSESRTTHWNRGLIWGSVKANVADCCAMGKLLFCRGREGGILWSMSCKLQWKKVKGLEDLKGYLKGALSKKISSNSAGNLVIFWNMLGDVDPESLEIWSAEISVKAHKIYDTSVKEYKIDEILGRIIRSDVAEVLYSAPIYT